MRKPLYIVILIFLSIHIKGQIDDNINGIRNIESLLDIESISESNLDTSEYLIPIKKLTKAYSIFDSSIIEIIKNNSHDESLKESLCINNKEIVKISGTIISCNKEDSNLIICSGYRDSTYIYRINIKKSQFLRKSYKSFHHRLISLSSHMVSFFDDSKNEIVIIDYIKHETYSIKFDIESEYISSHKISDNLFLINTCKWDEGFYVTNCHILDLKNLRLKKLNNNSKLEETQYSYKDCLLDTNLCWYSINELENQNVKRFFKEMNSISNKSLNPNKNNDIFCTNNYLGCQILNNKIEYYIFSRKIKGRLYGVKFKPDNKIKSLYSKCMCNRSLKKDVVEKLNKEDLNDLIRYIIFRNGALIFPHV